MKRTNFYATVRLFAVLLTALVIVAHEYLPSRTIQLYPSPERYSWIYGPDRKGTPSTDWIDQERSHLRCNFSAAIHMLVVGRQTWGLIALPG